MVDFAAKLKEQRAKEALEKQLDKARKSSAPNMNSSWTPRKPKDEEPPPPSIADLDIPAADRTRISALVEQHASITRTQGLLKKKKAILVDGGDIAGVPIIGVKQLCKLYSLDKFMVGDNRAAYYTSNRTTISKDLLLQNGVSPAIIKKCTVTKEVQQFKVSGPGVKSDEDDFD